MLKPWLIGVGGAVWLFSAAASVTVASPATGTAPAVRQARQPMAMAPAESRALLDQYCVTCHSSRLKTGGLVLEGRDTSSLAEDPAFWEQIVRKLRGGTMPPAGRPRPDTARGHALIASLERSLDEAAATAPNPGRPMIHRLNRTEYANAVRDLLALPVDAATLLPPDTSGFGFDNVADVLTMSPGLLDRYISAAHRVGRAAMGDPAIRADLKRYNISRMLLQEDRETEAQPFGTRGGTTVQHHFPLDGEYLFRVDFHMSYNQRRVDVRGRHEDNQLDFRVDGERVTSVVLTKATTVNPNDRYGATSDGLDPVEVRVPVKAGTHEVSVSFARKIAAATEGVGPTRLPQSSSSYWWFTNPSNETGKFEMGLSFLDIQGPFSGQLPQDTPSRRRLLLCRPGGALGEDACATRILTTLARRAYRRPATADEMATLMSFYEKGYEKGGFEPGVEFALERVLVAPQFLFRSEEGPTTGASHTGASHKVSDLDLASRLSFFLWSSIPDDTLLDLATRGRLSTPAVLDQQVRRMLADAKSDAMLDNFFGQWLWLRNMATVRPNTDIFPGFDDTLRSAMQRETALFIQSQVREDHGVADLLTANYTFVNERLARHYGIPNVYGADFRRVTLPDGPRAGLLGQGSVLTVTAYPNRTSPVVRAKWMLENLLGTPPPEPPPNVPQLKDDEKGQAPSSMRAKMEAHRKNPVCASCHSMLDPLGFSLENFDAVGQFRASEGDGITPIDPSGVMPSGLKFSGPAGFRAALLEQEETFAITLTQKLLTYGLGRGAEYYDMPAVRKIVRDAAPGKYRWSALVSGIVKSVPFQLRRSEQ